MQRAFKHARLYFAFKEIGCGKSELTSQNAYHAIFYSEDYTEDSDELKGMIKNFILY